MSDSTYDRWRGDDFAHCVALFQASDWKAPLEEAFVRAATQLGLGPRPATAVDLEQLQLVDYTSLPGVNDEQRRAIAKAQAEEAIKPEEMIFLALRSLYQFSWPDPESNDDIRFAAACEYTLNQALIGRALDLAFSLNAPDASLPYWGRLAFLNVMASLPQENVERFGLVSVACGLVKKAKFNATTVSLPGGSVILLNYALQPILKHLNRFLLHYFGTNESAGPNRVQRAWEGIVATVLHFWSEVPVMEITRPSMPIYGEDHALLVHELTTHQVEFIVAHELGHVALDHPRRLRAEQTKNHDTTTIRHEFEFAADDFALGTSRSRLVHGFASRLKTKESAESADERLADLGHGLMLYQRALGGAYLLFLYMDFIQRAGELLQSRLGLHLAIRSRIDSHPLARDRLERLERVNLGEHLYTSPLQRYAREFLQSVLDHAAGLNEAALLASVVSR